MLSNLSQTLSPRLIIRIFKALLQSSHQIIRMCFSVVDLMMSRKKVGKKSLGGDGGKSPMHKNIIITTTTIIIFSVIIINTIVICIIIIIIIIIIPNSDTIFVNKLRDNSF